MDLKREGLNVEINFADFSDPELVAAASEMSLVATERGLILPLGSEAVEAAQTAEAPEATERSIADVKEYINDQLLPSRWGYTEMHRGINRHERKKSKKAAVEKVALSDLLYVKLEEWEENGALEYVKNQLEADPELRYTLVAQPNIVISKDELKRLAQDFGKDQPYETFIYDPLYDQYTDEELSGVTDPDLPIRFLLIPNKTDESLYGTVAQQNADLKQRQADKPFLVVPAPAVAPSIWYRLRVGGVLPASKDPNDFVGVFDQTYIRHFDMEPKRLGGGLCVPDSCVSVDGGPGLYRSGARYDYHARVAVG